MTKSFRTGLAVVAVLSALLTAQAAFANGSGGPEPVPLTGEVLITSELGDPGTSEVSGDCNELGESTFTFVVTGVAIGPYPGTFREEGTIVVGPFGVPEVGFAPVSFDATFTITSPQGMVTGTKTLTDPPPPGFGACGEFVGAGTEAEAIDFQGNTAYTATITTPGGTATDTGLSFVSYADTQIRGRADFEGFSFGESFTSTSFSVDDDDDDGGDDDGDDDDGDDGGGGDG
jgi:hypothetical protein